ncbi:MAG: polysaccharide biosynthesis protein, partial [Oscillospiraceae bacterium]
PGDLFVQKSPASTIEDLARGVQQLFGDTGIHVIGTRHGEKLYETLLTREERVRSEDLGGYYRVSADGRDLNYDKYFVNGAVQTQADEAYTSHNTQRLDVQGVVDKLMELDYIKEELDSLGK